MIRHYLFTVTALDVGIGVSDGDLRWLERPLSEESQSWPLMLGPQIYWNFRGRYKTHQILEILVGCLCLYAWEG